MNNDELLIKEKYEQLCNQKGIILLNSMDSARRERIHRIVERYPNMTSFSIGEEGERQIVLRYFAFERINIGVILNAAQEDYKQENYGECEEKYLHLLQTLSSPKPFIYARLGLLYREFGYIDMAIDYLTVATYLSKGITNKKILTFDFSDMIKKLKRLDSNEETKPAFKMSQSDFDYSDTTEFYGINNFNEITTYIVETGLDVETACQMLNMSEEEIDIIKLIYAREFYKQGDITQGDLFLKDVEKRKNKSMKVTKLLNETRTNKRFYQNRAGDSSTPLSLSLRPHK